MIFLIALEKLKRCAIVGDRFELHTGPAGSVPAGYSDILCSEEVESKGDLHRPDSCWLGVHLFHGWKHSAIYGRHRLANTPH